jgi:triosephosphate isomerase
MPHTTPPLIIGNWKMNGTAAAGVAIAKKLHELPSPATCDIVICPPAPLLAILSMLLKDAPIMLGAQDCHYEPEGAYTGDISALMMKEFFCRYVILGHSERRNYHKENNMLVKKKATAAHAAGLTAVICVGESREDRESGNLFSVLRKQLAGSIPGKVTPGDTVIAYEPVWAIGTGNVPSLAEITEVHHFISAFMRDNHQGSFRILYGGSVKPANAADILALPHIAGLLVGGCSLSADDFVAIINTATTLTRPLDKAL